jgi:diguanylate cyclase (GGDEF)-like protein
VSFRNRLALFFVLIVIVPMLAVTFLVFRLIGESERGQTAAAIAQQHSTAAQLFGEQRRLAGAVLTEVASATHTTAAIKDLRSALQDGGRGRARAQAAAERIIAGQRRLPIASRRIQRIVFLHGRTAVVHAGDRTAIAPAVGPLESKRGRTLGTLALSVSDASTFAHRVQRLTTIKGERPGLHVVVLNGSKLLGSTLPHVDAAALARADDRTLTVGGVDYRVRSFTDYGAFGGQKIRVFTLGSLAGDANTTSGNRVFAAVILLGFLLLALACAMLVSRTLQREIARFRPAARKLAAGDFSAKVPTVGRDEFAELGEEFNKMSAELERRLAELSQERGRVQDSMRRLGEAVASNLDRDALLELVVRTAVDGVGADAGRACVRNGSGALDERSRVGDLNGLETAIESVEAEALGSGQPRETTAGETTAIAHPLRGAEALHDIVGVVSVARSGRPFSPGDRELFSYLAGQAARSMENVELHESTARRSVTDELTGLSNRRAFDAALTAEIERAKRFGTELSLVLIDLDDFKQVNDTYGHPQGDVVLREVARVLRESSREVDHPARYGGEELAAVLPGTDVEGAFNRAERIRELIGQLRIPRLDGGGTLNITASCGVASARGPGADGRALVQSADSALYEAKRSGKNKSVRAR